MTPPSSPKAAPSPPEVPPPPLPPPSAPSGSGEDKEGVREGFLRRSHDIAEKTISVTRSFILSIREGGGDGMTAALALPLPPPPPPFSSHPPPPSGDIEGTEGVRGSFVRRSPRIGSKSTSTGGTEGRGDGMAAAMTSTSPPPSPPPSSLPPPPHPRPYQTMDEAEATNGVTMAPPSAPRMAPPILEVSPSPLPLPPTSSERVEGTEGGPGVFLRRSRRIAEKLRGSVGIGRAPEGREWGGR